MAEKRSNSDCLFVSYVPPFKPVSAKTLARWLVTFLSMAGVNTSLFGQHATRSASVNYLKNVKNISVKEICKIADWSQMSGVFEKFYDKTLKV